MPYIQKTISYTKKKSKGQQLVKTSIWLESVKEEAKKYERKPGFLQINNENRVELRKFFAKMYTKINKCYQCCCKVSKSNKQTSTQFWYLLFSIVPYNITLVIISHNTFLRSHFISFDVLLLYKHIDAMVRDDWCALYVCLFFAFFCFALFSNFVERKLLFNIRPSIHSFRHCLNTKSSFRFFVLLCISCFSLFIVKALLSVLFFLFHHEVECFYYCLFIYSKFVYACAFLFSFSFVSLFQQIKFCYMYCYLLLKKKIKYLLGITAKSNTQFSYRFKKFIFIHGCMSSVSVNNRNVKKE